MIQFLYTKDYKAEMSQESQILDKATLLEDESRDTEHLNSPVLSYSAFTSATHDATDLEAASKDDAAEQNGDPVLHESILDTHPNVEDCTSQIIAHVQVNSIADYYDIPPLLELSRRKIRHFIETCRSAISFPDFVEAVFTTTGDKELHDFTCFTAAKHMDELIEKEILSGLDAGSEFFQGTIKHMHQLGKAAEKLSKDETTDLFVKLIKSSDDASSASNEAKRWKENAENYKQKTQSFLRTVSGTTQCRNQSCHSNLGAILETAGTDWLPLFTFRCHQCRCKHN